MHWIQITTTLPPAHAEAMEESFSAAGASAVTMTDAEDQPIFEPDLGTTPLWPHTQVTGLFSASDDIEDVMQIITAVFREMTGQTAPQLKSDLLENEDWTRKWIENFQPIKFGNSLWVCPSWRSAPEPGAVNLMLDPGLAFGTGTHPTTALCLAWLDASDLHDKTVVDYGCGSGILGIAALLLGAKNVIAVDNDPQALLATKDNAARNAIHPETLHTCLPEDMPEISADVVVANILAKPLFELRDVLAKLLLSDGEIIMSGILEPQAAELSKHYSQRFTMHDPVIESGWTRLNGRRL